MAYTKIPEKAKDLHNELITDLHDRINKKIDQHDFEKLKNRLKTKLTPMDLMHCENVLQVYERLEKKGRVSPGNYDTFIHLVECIDVTWVNFIREKAEEINKIIREENQDVEDTRKKRNYEDGDNGTESLDKCSSPKKVSREVMPKFYYEQKPHQKGYLLILNFNRKREGAKGDVKKIQTLFKDTLEFECHVEEDLSKEHVIKLLKETSDMLNSMFQSKRYFCFLMFIMSHGDKEGIMTNDELKIPFDDIVSFFRSDKIPEFAGKPRCFFIQACRGGDPQLPVDLPDEFPLDISDMVGKISIPTDADLLLAYATTPGHPSFRRSFVGAWFLDVLVSTFRENYHTEHIEEMLIDVKYRLAYDEKWQTVEGHKQMPCTWSTLTKRLSLIHQHS